MRTLRHLSFALTSIVVAGITPAEPRPFSLRIQVSQVGFQSCSSVEIKLTLTNRSNSEIMIVDTRPWCDYQFQIKNVKANSPRKRSANAT